MHQVKKAVPWQQSIKIAELSLELSRAYSYFLVIVGLAISAIAKADLVESRLLRLDESEIIFYLDQPNTASFPLILFLQGSECHQQGPL